MCEGGSSSSSGMMSCWGEVGEGSDYSQDFRASHTLTVSRSHKAQAQGMRKNPLASSWASLQFLCGMRMTRPASFCTMSCMPIVSLLIDRDSLSLRDRSFYSPRGKETLEKEV